MIVAQPSAEASGRKSEPDSRPAPLAPGWSLKRRIHILGFLAGLTLVSATLLGLQLLHLTESARMTDAATQVNLALERMTRHFENAARASGLRAAPESSPIANHDTLRSIALESLTDLTGLEGGFYALTEGRLLGYAFPTYLGSGPKTDIPEAERPAILRLVRHAVATQTAVQERIERGFDVILFGAAPLLHEGRSVGATWVMHRLPGIRNPQWRNYGVALLVMLTMAGLVAGGAWFIAHRLDHAVMHLIERIHMLPQQAPHSMHATGNAELDRVVFAINRLVKAVRRQQARREQLERRLHHTDRLAILGRLVAGVAHEVRNPLSSIRLKLQLAGRGPLDPMKLMSTFDVVEQEISRLDRLVARLLSLARPASTGETPTNLSRFIEGRLQHWRTRGVEFDVVVDCSLTESANGATRVDQDRLGQILDNLMANAFDAVSDTGGTIQIDGSMDAGGTLQLAVTDSGPGISEEVRAHLFEPFFTTRPHGTGLGLFLSAEMARASGGTLVYVQPPQGGSRFEIRLPSGPEEAFDGAAERPSLEEKEHSHEAASRL